MKAQVVSDLHLEMEMRFMDDIEEIIPVIGNILILPGDIGIGNHPDFLKFFEWASTNFENVIYVPGNHEFYHHEYFDILEKMKEMLSLYSNIHFLHKSSVSLKGIKFLGTTLWAHPPTKRTQDMVQKKYNDYNYIFFREDLRKKKPKNSSDEEEKEDINRDGKFVTRYLTIQDTSKFHEEELNWLESEVKKSREKEEICYVISHHLPLLGLKFLPPNERNMKQKDTWFGNMTDNSDFILRNLDVIKAWFHGHTHNSLVTTFGKFDLLETKRKSRVMDDQEKQEKQEKEERIWIISNQVGYSQEKNQSGYDKNLKFEFPLQLNPEKIDHEEILLEDEELYGRVNMEIWGEIEVEEDRYCGVDEYREKIRMMKKKKKEEIESKEILKNNEKKKIKCKIM